MPRKPPPSPVKFKQQTLTGFFSSPVREASGSSPAKRTHRSRRRVPTPEPESASSDDSDVAGIKFEPEIFDLSEEDSSPRRPKANGTSPSRRIVGSDDDEDSELNLRSIKRAKKNKKLGKRKQVIEESESEEEVQPKKRKFMRGVRPPSPEEDDVDILDEVEEHRIIECRFRQRNKKTSFQKNLEKMKRKKKGLPALDSSESSQSGAEGSDTEEDDLFVTPFAGAKPDSADDSHDDEELPDDSFIVEDDDGPAVLPMEYSMDTHQDLAHHFKIICQLFVHIAVRPGGERHTFMKETMIKEDYFSVPLQIARRKLLGLRDSLVASSVWRPDFKNKLQRYPDLELTQLDFSVPHCDACHLGGRLSTVLGRVGGVPYDKFGFQPLDEQDSVDDSDEERQSWKEFNLGRFCAKRTQVFHRFTHWEQAVFGSLCREVDGLRARERGQHGFVHVAFGKGKKPPEDLTDADGIMDWLDERGVIDAEWHNIKQLMESARNLETAAKKGDDDLDVG